MNLRNELAPKKGDKSYIRFDLDEDSCDWDINCTKEELINWLANIVFISHKMMTNNLNEDMDIQKQIVNNWLKDLRDLFLNDEEWVS